MLIINWETTYKCVKLEISTLCNKSFWIENDTSPQYGLHPFSSFPLMCAPPKLQMLACAMGAAPKAWKRRFAPCTSYEFHGGSFSSTTNLFLTDFFWAQLVWLRCECYAVGLIDDLAHCEENWGEEENQENGQKVVPASNRSSPVNLMTILQTHPFAIIQ